MGVKRKGWGGGRCEAREGESGEQSDCMEGCTCIVWTTSVVCSSEWVKKDVTVLLV